MQTKLYTEDWIGLKTLDDAGKVSYISVPGKHLGISDNDAKKYVVPYLEDQASEKDSIKRLIMHSRNHAVHRAFPQSHTETLNVPHSEDDASSGMLDDGSSSYSWPASVTKFFEEQLGFADEESPPHT